VRHTEDVQMQILEKVMELQAPRYAAMRERSQNFKIKEQELEAEKAVTDHAAPGQIACLKKNLIRREKDKEDKLEEVRKAYEVVSQKLLDQHRVDIERLKKENDCDIKHHEGVLKEKEKENLRLRKTMEDICDSRSIVREQEYPIEYNEKVLGAKWNEITEKPIGTLRFGSYEAPATNIRDEKYFASAFATVTAMSQSPFQQVNVDGCFSKLSNPPTERSLALACFVAHVLQWVFDSPFHVDDSERDDMNNTYSWVTKKCKYIIHEEMTKLTIPKAAFKW
jgi:hypothetical protein